MNLQEQYDTVVKHLRTQKAKSVEVLKDGSTRICKYREANLKCAAGVLIPDEEYNKEMEYKTWYQVIGEFENLPEYLKSPASVALVRDLQIVHDMAHNGYPTANAVYEAQLMVVANKHGLKYTPPN